MKDLLTDPRFQGIEVFQNKAWFSSPTMHGEEQHWVDDAILPAQYDETEEWVKEYIEQFGTEPSFF